MSLAHFLFERFRSIGTLGRFLIMLFIAAAFNFLEIFSEHMKASMNAGSRTVGDYTITACYFGPPTAFYTRFFIAVSLLVAGIGVFHRSFPRSAMTVIGLASAVGIYIFWWVASYRVLQNFSDIHFDFLNNPEIKQAAYLYQGAWSDVSIAATAFVCLVLVLDRLFNHARPKL